MSGHTPGPWEVDFTGLRVKSIYATPGSDYSELYPVTGVGIGVNSEANARLIAAAPDLLEACKALPDFDLDNPDAADFKDNSQAFMNAMRLAQAAIAKAEGHSESTTERT